MNVTKNLPGALVPMAVFVMALEGVAFVSPIIAGIGLAGFLGWLIVRLVRRGP